MANRQYYHFTCSIQLAVYIISVIAAAPSGPLSEPEIKLVTVIFRHGDRTPDDNGRELYPNDPYQNYTFPPIGLGHLTNEGKQREYELGDFLRKRYDDFLGPTYVPSDLSAHSTDYVRTKMSLQLVLAALYPPHGLQIWNEYLNWQPIPTTYTKAIDDDLMIPEECPLYLEEYNRIMKIPEVAQEINVFENFMKNLTDLTGKNITTPEDMYYLYHTLMAEWSMNLTLPYWANQVFPDGKLWDGTILSYKLSNYNTLLKRLNGGKLLKRVTDEMLNRMNNVNTRSQKMYLFSGHETNVAALLQTLRVFEPHVPQYSSAVIMELLQDYQQNYFVKVIHYLGIPSKANVLSLPGCEELCPFERFLNITYRVIPTDEELNCDKTLTPAYSKPISQSATSKTSYNLINTYRERENAH